ncbi:MAG TPA: AMP-binding protein [Pseudomonadales bacterium]|nr:AMP-binding protein [Pseudomonadales bacterium]
MQDPVTDIAGVPDTDQVIDAVRQRLGYPLSIELPSVTIPEILRQAVNAFSDKPAYTCLGKTISYADVDRLSTQFAAYLQHQTDLQPGDRIAIQLPNVLQYPVVVFGAMRAGLVVVNTNPLYTPHEMQHQFLDAGVKAVVILANVASKLETVLANTAIRHVIVTELADLHDWPQRVVINAAAKYLKKMVPPFHLSQAVALRKALASGSQYPVKPVSQKRDDIAVLQYTGGTTGVAKGAMLTHENLLANVRQCAIFMEKAGINRGGEIVVAPLPLYHIYAFMLHILLMMESGNHSLLIPDPRNIAAVAKTLARHRFSVFIGINTLFVALAHNEAFRKLDFSALKLTFSGGMALTETAAKLWQQTSGCAVIEGYGLTESSPVLTVNPPGHARIGSIGIPLANTAIRILDDNGVVQPVGMAGELCARGPQVMKGYWQREQATAETVVNGWLHTGDIAVADPDGFIRIVDRKKDMIIVSGFNVYPNEIENVMSAHPDIIECAAVGIPDELSGEAVKLFVVSRNPALDVEQVRQFARKEMTAYKVPKQVEFRETLPKSNVGKILRRELRG